MQGGIALFDEPLGKNPSRFKKSRTTLKLLASCHPGPTAVYFFLNQGMGISLHRNLSRSLEMESFAAQARM